MEKKMKIEVLKHRRQLHQNCIDKAHGDYFLIYGHPEKIAEINKELKLLSKSLQH